MKEVYLIKKNGKTVSMIKDRDDLEKFSHSKGFEINVIQVDDKDFDKVTLQNYKVLQIMPVVHLENKLALKKIYEGLNDKTTIRPIQWARDDTGFLPVGKLILCNKIDPGVYRIETYPQLKLMPVQSKTDNLLKFKDSAMNTVVSEIDRFWKLKPNFENLGFLHNRGLLLYGPPGSGKSSVLQEVAEAQTGRGEITLFSHGLDGLQVGLEAIRNIEPERRLVVMLEDIDGYMYNERNLLQLLDGENQLADVLYLATTNYKEKLSPRLMRPGRFDKHIYIGNPSENNRYIYLKNKLSEVETDDTIKRIAKQTDGFSFGHLRELTISAYAFKEDLNSTITRLRNGSRGLVESEDKDWRAKEIRKIKNKFGDTSISPDKQRESRNQVALVNSSKSLDDYKVKLSKFKKKYSSSLWT